MTMTQTTTDCHMANPAQHTPEDQWTVEKLQGFRKQHFLPTALTYYQDPLLLTKAEGSYVVDHEGRRFLDFIGGIVCIAAGHNHPKITAKLQSMLAENTIQHTSMLYLNPHPVMLAERLVAEAPQGINRVAFTNSGSEANELAMMAARNATGETMVMHLRHGYHGGTSGTLASCGHHSWRFRSQPVTSVTSAEAPYCYRCPFGQKAESCNLECAKHVENTIQTTTHGKLAAFIAEPVMGVGGFIAPEKEYFQAVEKIVHNYGGKYISDEVQTGVGRTGESFFYTKSLGIQADMISMAKGLGNGAAIGAVMMTDAVADPLQGKLYFNTFGGDPYQTAQAWVQMDVMAEERMVENAEAMGKRLEAGLKDLMSRHRLVGDVRGRGLLMGIELVTDRQTKAYATAECAQLMEKAKAKGLLIGKGGLFGNVVRLAPPISVTAEEIDNALRVLDEALTELEA